jgi:hypothetical protein
MNDAHANEMQVQMWKPNTWVLHFLGLLKSGTTIETKSSSQFHILATWSFESFLKQKHSSLYTAQMALSNHSVVYESLPRRSKFFCLLLVSPTSKRFMRSFR